jgi:hypothetical protein
MNYNVKLGRISGIEIGLHYSWFIIAALIVFSLGEHFRQVNPNWGRGRDLDRCALHRCPVLRHLAPA